MLTVAVIPIIKDKSGKITSKNNYRPVASASAMSKVLEVVVFNKVKSHLISTCNQFGFKEKSGTDLPIYLLKEIIARYKTLNANIFMCFLDASKAFDRVNHCLLFSKLLKRGVPVFVVRLLSFWYSHQALCVKWAGLTSDVFSVSNGVRQGGILSPYLFNVYVDDLSHRLNKCKTGCYIGGKLVNHTMYADDLVILSPNDKGLDDLIRICKLFADDHDMLFNATKSAVMVHRSRYSMDIDQLEFKLYNEVVPIVEKYKYLGHILCNNLRDDADMARQCRILYAQGNVLRQRFYMCNVDVKLKLFQTFCYPVYIPVSYHTSVV